MCPRKSDERVQMLGHRRRRVSSSRWIGWEHSRVERDGVCVRVGEASKGQESTGRTPQRQKSWPVAPSCVVDDADYDAAGLVSEALFVPRTRLRVGARASCPSSFGARQPAKQQIPNDN